MKISRDKNAIALSRAGHRKLRQDMHKPMVVQNKKKVANKYACRSASRKG